MKHPILVVLAIILCLSSCKRREDVSTKDISESFPVDISLAETQYEMPIDMAIKQWAINADTLYVITEARDSVVVVMDSYDFSIMNSFGQIGNGPDEYVMPVLLPSDKDGMFLADASKGVMYGLNPDGVSLVNSNIATMPFNDARLLSLPYMIGLEYSPMGTRLIIRNILNGSILSNMDFSASDFPSGVSTKDIVVNGYGNYEIVAYIGKDQFEILEMEGERFNTIRVFKGNATVGEDKFFYIDSYCGVDYFALLSVKNTNPTAPKSSILFYQYDGTPIASIALDFWAYRLLIDEVNNYAIMLSPDDNDFHVVSLRSFMPSE